ncbi:hypothetical protein ABZ890_41575 [Streptomyces sp. NPDC046984]|uniref:hypothetical protein n=1 Tax=Streptomyces sp. NPDC046984 TaxID=3155138 RepID=UPI0033CE8596
MTEQPRDEAAVSVQPGDEATGSGRPAAGAEQTAAETGQQPEPNGFTAPPEAPVKKRVRRGRIAAVAASVVLAGAVVGLVTTTAVIVQGADRDPGAPTWKFPPAPKDEAKQPKAASPLAAMLVPYGTGDWGRGPDIAEFGSDAALSGNEAAALRKEAIRDLPRTQRRRLEQQIDKQHTKGMAMRSYMNTSADGSDSFTVSVELVQIEDKAAVRNISQFQNGFLEALRIFRKGPKIKGYKNAECFLPPAEKKEKLDMMLCSAYRGDVLVTATAYGVKPLHTDTVAELLREQLDRVAGTGEAV